MFIAAEATNDLDTLKSFNLLLSLRQPGLLHFARILKLIEVGRVETIN
jgi:hypothetical protein